ncbi:zinc finger BED domain-containing protein DAYSLEEPER-like [Magnolia sinica]|uniref:zinc finger BED domain-containing protein DAYSLEEPER-like n=1 Tax=Magnolia sinica TaxID=86752 RepID=UPI002658D006|nr:zinc finger BED domain-containing protein DAYSLEEPER-like [Magnolia sinica]
MGAARRDTIGKSVPAFSTGSSDRSSYHWDPSSSRGNDDHREDTYLPNRVNSSKKPRTAIPLALAAPLRSSIAGRLSLAISNLDLNFNNGFFIIICDVYEPAMVIELTKKIRETFNRIYDEYQKLHCTSEQLISLKSKFQKHLEEEENYGGKSEVDKYLEESCEKDDPNFEILNWWKVNSSKYRVLSQVARDILAIPVSTVASESAFSTGGHVLDQFHSSLTPKLVKCLICAQDWLRASPLPIQVEENMAEIEALESALSSI